MNGSIRVGVVIGRTRPGRGRSTFSDKPAKTTAAFLENGIQTPESERDLKPFLRDLAAGLLNCLAGRHSSTLSPPT
jgi:hypothetical protein